MKIETLYYFTSGVIKYILKWNQVYQNIDLSQSNIKHI